MGRDSVRWAEILVGRDLTGPRFSKVGRDLIGPRLSKVGQDPTGPKFSPTRRVVAPPISARFLCLTEKKARGVEMGGGGRD